MDDMADFLDGSAAARVDFVWDRTFQAHAPGPRVERGCHVFAFNKGGGSLIIRIEDETGPARIVCGKGDMCVLPAWTKRRNEVVTDVTGGVVRLLIAGLRFSVLAGADLLSFWETPRLIPRRSVPELAGALASLSDIHGGFSAAPMKNLAALKAHCFKILELTLALSKLKPGADSAIGACSAIEPALRRINSDFKKDLHIAELAGLCFLSRSQFCHNFKRLVGKPPFEYQKTLRIEKAKQLLAMTNMSVAETGLAAGWNDQFHFSRIFKSSTGYSPALFRARFHKEPSPQF
jgi:AraC-like DNA-binding protein